MVFLFGKKQIKRRAGCVADYCPVCHEIMVTEFFHVVWGRRFLPIPLGRSISLGSQIRCTVCGTQSATHVHRYASIERKRPENLQALIQATFPNIHEVYAPQVAFEKLLREGLPLVPEDRLKLLTDPMLHLNVPVAKLFSREIVFDGHLGISALITLVLFSAMLLSAVHLSNLGIYNNIWQAIMLCSIGCFVVALIYTLVQVPRGKDRILRRKYCPILAKSIARLRPTRDEISQSIAQCRSQGTFIGHVLKADVLWAALQQIDPAGMQSEPGKAMP